MTIYLLINIDVVICIFFYAAVFFQVLINLVTVPPFYFRREFSENQLICRISYHPSQMTSKDAVLKSSAIRSNQNKQSVSSIGILGPGTRSRGTPSK